MNKVIEPALISRKKKYDLRKIDDFLRKGDPDAVNQMQMSNLKFQAARVQFYVDTFIPKPIQGAFYDVMQDYVEWHILIANAEMRHAVKGNAFAPAVDARAEGGDEAATISIEMNAKHPGIKTKDLIKIIMEERERVLGIEHRNVDRSTVHRHLKRVGLSRRKRK